MRSKHFISDPQALVDGLCRSLLAQNGALRYDTGLKVVFLPPPEKDDGCVRLISEGGSGHEPAHAGYVGRGMLDAAVCGAIFASPNVDQIAGGLDHISSPHGILAIVKNYTGDKLNFALAVQEYRAKTGLPVEIILVGDDVAVPRSRNQTVGRRGLAGTVLVHKIAGAAAQRGYDLKKVVAIARHVADNLATMGVSLNHCSVPGSSKVNHLGENEIELGMGIHNEPGISVVSPQPDMPSLIDSMLMHILDPGDPERAYLSQSKIEGSDFILLVNNLGGLSNLELSGIANVVLERLSTVFSLRPVRLVVGSYLTSLDGPGFSITLLNLTDQDQVCTVEDLLLLFDDRTDAIAWPNRHLGLSKDEAIIERRILSQDKVEVNGTKPSSFIPCKQTSSIAVLIADQSAADETAFLSRVLQRIREKVVQWEPDMTKFDTLMGDGDCGTTLLAGIEAVCRAYSTTDSRSLIESLLNIASTARKSMGGTSGALYGLFLGGFAAAIPDVHGTDHPITLQSITSAAMSALVTLEHFTGAREGSRTLMDALIPAIVALQSGVDSSSSDDAIVEKALLSARAGMEGTKQMSSSFGRSSYVGSGGTGSNYKDPTAGIPDPGACGVVAIFEGLYAACREGKKGE